MFPSPFEAFDAHDRDAGFPDGTVRGIIRTSSETGAWAALERGELALPDFHSQLEAEALEVGPARRREAHGHRRGRLRSSSRDGQGDHRIREKNLRTAALTNNWPRPDGAEFPPTGNGLGFDVVIESAVVGLRKPDPRIYELVLSKLGVDAPDAVFLDDLGINLKPARAMGMTTIKVTDPDRALAELGTFSDSRCADGALVGAARRTRAHRAGTGVRADPALTARHRAGARLAEWLAFEPIDAIVCSPLRRGRHRRRSRRAAASRSRSSTASSSTTPTPTTTSRWRSCASTRTIAGRRWSTGDGTRSAPICPRSSGPGSTRRSRS